mmetsp:Transcript_14135/g.34874  ORF Transcript_14135/g.34874 Transcript_14135/m.34874 type:complete len:208 (-) Transcript_14135:14-637(-)
MLGGEGQLLPAWGCGQRAPGRGGEGMCRATRRTHGTHDHYHQHQGTPRIQQHQQATPGHRGQAFRGGHTQGMGGPVSGAGCCQEWLHHSHSAVLGHSHSADHSQGRHPPSAAPPAAAQGHQRRLGRCPCGSHHHLQSAAAATPPTSGGGGCKGGAWGRAGKHPISGPAASSATASPATQHGSPTAAATTSGQRTRHEGEARGGGMGL